MSGWLDKTACCRASASGLPEPEDTFLDDLRACPPVLNLRTAARLSFVQVEQTQHVCN